ncbi:LysR family transcriptional regulator [Marinomonas mediterranea]|uniref:LysR family transcriptional regulator n=1 Tax=Marinomonas mediterranea TaxID=119864 RepID=UPI00234936BB|nr:LysR family transcriptional regulator [Marinomonas mediterranea]WCN11855.1 LysR family transcriptional regulator [Marinomonas mediterranea]
MTPNQLLELLPELAVFVAVVEEGSFTNAGKKLGLPPSSISRTISKLETGLTTKLLERTTRRVAVNSIGREVFESAKNMLNSAKSAVDITQSRQNHLTGELRIAAPKAFTKLILASIVFEFMEANPTLTLKVTASDHIIDPSSGEVDLIYRLTNQPIDGLVARKVANVKQVICASPTYLKRKQIPSRPEDLTQHNCISLGEFEGDHIWHFDQSGHTEKVKTQGNFSSNHSEIRKEAVLRHMGISAFPEFAVKEELESEMFIPLLQDWHFSGTYQGEVFAQYSQSRYVPIQIRRFIEFSTPRIAHVLSDD